MISNTARKRSAVALVIGAMVFCVFALAVFLSRSRSRIADLERAQKQVEIDFEAVDDRYHRAVLCATNFGMQLVSTMALDPKSPNSQEDAEILVSVYRANDLRDRKTALVLGELERKAPELVAKLSPENREYLDQVSAKWTGKSLGFPDKW